MKYAIISDKDIDDYEFKIMVYGKPIEELNDDTV